MPGQIFYFTSMPLILFLIFAQAIFAAAPQTISRDTSARVLFMNPDVKTSYSELMLEKNSRADSLLPALNGDMVFADLIAANPYIWSLENLRKVKGLSTNLKVDIVYVDGTREEAYCDFSKTTSAENWNLTIGVDFVSGSSNTAAIHVTQCIEFVKDSIGYVMQDSTGKTLVIPPKKILEEIEKVEIPSIIPIDLQTKLLNAHKSVEETGECPADIEAYMILFDVWKAVEKIEMDIPLISDALYDETVQSCAFNREWNKRYNELATFYCNISDICEYNQSEDGKTYWVWNSYDNRLEYKQKKIAFISYGKKSIHDGGTMLDLRIVPLSSRLFLEVYMDLQGEPVSLGLIILSS